MIKTLQKLRWKLILVAQIHHVLLRSKQCPTVLCRWVTNAADPQDIDQASNRIRRGLLALCQALKATELQLANVQGLTPVHLESYNMAALQRIQQRATTTGRELVRHVSC